MAHLRTEAVLSARNPVLKEIRRAISKGSLTQDGLMVVENPQLIEEAARSGSEIAVLLATEAALARLDVVPCAHTIVLSERAFQSISATEAAQGVMALVHPKTWRHENVFGGDALALVLDGIQDPGNAGTMLRAAEAFGATGTVFLKGSVNPYHPKVIRASAGSIFRVPVLTGIDAAEVKSQGIPVFTAMPHGGTPIASANLRQPMVVVVGNEAHGVGPEFANSPGLRIPTGGVESLNAAMSAAIILYEARRQRTP